MRQYYAALSSALLLMGTSIATLMNSTLITM